ncbi:MAG TPA: hypothetical protein VF702_05315 [Allosphingosinicella sp.]|jgi:hypothetical protein
MGLTMFAAIAMAALAGAQDGGQRHRPIEWSWIVGPPMSGARTFPTRFELRSGGAELIAGSYVLPNVLVALEEAAPSPIDPAVAYTAGMQLFQLSGRRQATFCTFRPLRRSHYHCFLDGDGDGRLDSVASARASLVSPPVLTLDAEVAALPAPLAIRTLPREEATVRFNMVLSYIGRRRFTRRDATFEVVIGNGEPGGFSVSPPMRLYLDELPAETVLGGVRLVDIERSGNRLRFNVASGFPEGPLPLRYRGVQGMEWGF